MSAETDEVPIGAVIVKNGQIIAKAHNTRNQSKNAVEHAELTAISNACKNFPIGGLRAAICTLL